MRFSRIVGFLGIRTYPKIYCIVLLMKFFDSISEIKQWFVGYELYIWNYQSSGHCISDTCLKSAWPKHNDPEQHLKHLTNKTIKHE